MLFAFHEEKQQKNIFTEINPKNTLIGVFEHNKNRVSASQIKINPSS